MFPVNVYYLFTCGKVPFELVIKRCFLRNMGMKDIHHSKNGLSFIISGSVVFVFWGVLLVLGLNLSNLCFKRFFVLGICGLKRK